MATAGIVKIVGLGLALCFLLGAADVLRPHAKTTTRAEAIVSNIPELSETSSLETLRQVVNRNSYRLNNLEENQTEMAKDHRALFFLLVGALITTTVTLATHTIQAVRKKASSP